ncbi:hypothetical protein AW14_13280 [Siansivirga zeaxanthinifaciens CC-SAMT-1]|uniref:Uncharacterized protein n=1 Tax=Siansivirga zeaxanthinifaciens CC-SAMT-1 TaxID=1454006 RepID=A0A0C5WD22_9FLAO|nr:hypothetical protein AW14_13280 [Siansivirga zeaxanthinifaciens CC-SAMT-1]
MNVFSYFNKIIFFVCAIKNKDMLVTLKFYPALVGFKNIVLLKSLKLLKSNEIKKPAKLSSQVL